MDFNRNAIEEGCNLRRPYLHFRRLDGNIFLIIWPKTFPHFYDKQINNAVWPGWQRSRSLKILACKFGLVLSRWFWDYGPTDHKYISIFFLPFTLIYTGFPNLLWNPAKADSTQRSRQVGLAPSLSTRPNLHARIFLEDSHLLSLSHFTEADICVCGCQGLSVTLTVLENIWNSLILW